MIKKGEKVKQVAGSQAGTAIGEVYEVVAGDGDSWLNLDGTLDDGVCSDGEFFLKDDDGDIRYQVYPEDALTKWEKVA